MAKNDDKTYAERIGGVVELKRKWVATSFLLGKLKCEARSIRRVLRDMVAAKELKATKVSREMYFAAPGVKTKPPVAEEPAARSKPAKKAAKKKAAKASGKKAKKS